MHTLLACLSSSSSTSPLLPYPHGCFSILFSVLESAGWLAGWPLGVLDFAFTQH